MMRELGMAEQAVEWVMMARGKPNRTTEESEKPNTHLHQSWDWGSEMAIRLKNRNVTKLNSG